MRCTGYLNESYTHSLLLVKPIKFDNSNSKQSLKICINRLSNKQHSSKSHNDMVQACSNKKPFQIITTYQFLE